MNATTVNSFPAMHSFNSPRGVALAFIVLLHAAFFFVLSSGLGKQLVHVPGPDITVVNTLPVKPIEQPVHQIPLPGAERSQIEHQNLFVPPVEVDAAPPHIDAPPGEPIISGPPDTGRGEVIREPIVQAPEEDQHHPLSAPAYPAPEIRANHAGTVILRVEVLENGHIGNVELVQSSGFARLDEAAIREARRWRMKPGTRDGVPVVMWKEVPITFQLKDRGSTDL